MESLTPDQEVLNTVSGLRIETNEDIPQSRSFQYTLGEKETKFLKEEILEGETPPETSDHEEYSPAWANSCPPFFLDQRMIWSVSNDTKP